MPASFQVLAKSSTKMRLKGKFHVKDVVLSV